MKKILVIIFFLPLFSIAQTKADSTANNGTTAPATSALPNPLTPVNVIMTLKDWQSLIITVNNIGSKGYVVTLDQDIVNNIINQINKQSLPPSVKPK